MTLISLPVILLLVLLVIFLAGGVVHHRAWPSPQDPRPAYYTYASWSPLAMVLIILLVLLLTGNLRLR